MRLRGQVRVGDAATCLVIHDLGRIGIRIDDEKRPPWRRQDKSVQRVPGATVEGKALGWVYEKSMEVLWSRDGLRVMHVCRGGGTHHRGRAAQLHKALGDAKVTFQFGEAFPSVWLPDDVHGGLAVALKIYGEKLAPVLRPLSGVE